MCKKWHSDQTILPRKGIIKISSRKCIFGVGTIHKVRTLRWGEVGGGGGQAKSVHLLFKEMFSIV